jgi:hypothetical protein
MSPINKYLIENGERVTNPSQFTKGDVVYEELGRGYMGFIIPGKEKISENGHLKLLGIPVLEKWRLEDEGTIRFATLDLQSHQFEEGEHGHGVFKAREGSEIKKTIEKKLPRVH